MRKTLVFVYGLLSYLIFFATFLYSIGFVGNLVVPKSVDADPSGQGGSAVAAVAINLALLTVFALQHSVMARPAFKRWWTRFVPEEIERSTYVLLSSAALALLYWLWQPIGGVVWHAGSDWAWMTLQGLYFAGWGLVLYATMLIDHFDLFGMRQVTLYARGRTYRHHPFGTPSLYKWIRHPLYVGWFTVFWATPTMTVGHLLLAGVVTAYILVAIQLEERDLVGHLGDTYERYREEVPMFIPSPGRRATPPPAHQPAR